MGFFFCCEGLFLTGKKLGLFEGWENTSWVCHPIARSKSLRNSMSWKRGVLKGWVCEDLILKLYQFMVSHLNYNRPHQDRLYHDVFRTLQQAQHSFGHLCLTVCWVPTRRLKAAGTRRWREDCQEGSATFDVDQYWSSSCFLGFLGLFSVSKT